MVDGKQIPVSQVETTELLRLVQENNAVLKGMLKTMQSMDDRLAKERSFVFFDDAKSDRANCLRAGYFAKRMAVGSERYFQILIKAAGSMKRPESTR